MVVRQTGFTGTFRKEQRAKVQRKQAQRQVKQLRKRGKKAVLSATGKVVILPEIRDPQLFTLEGKIAKPERTKEGTITRGFSRLDLVKIKAEEDKRKSLRFIGTRKTAREVISKKADDDLRLLKSGSRFKTSDKTAVGRIFKNTEDEFKKAGVEAQDVRKVLDISKSKFTKKIPDKRIIPLAKVQAKLRKQKEKDKEKARREIKTIADKITKGTQRQANLAEQLIVRAGIKGDTAKARITKNLVKFGTLFNPLTISADLVGVGLITKKALKSGLIDPDIRDLPPATRKAFEKAKKITLKDVKEFGKKSTDTAIKLSKNLNPTTEKGLTNILKLSILLRADKQLVKGSKTLTKSIIKLSKNEKLRANLKKAGLKSVNTLDDILSDLTPSKLLKSKAGAVRGGKRRVSKAETKKRAIGQTRQQKKEAGKLIGGKDITKRDFKPQFAKIKGKKGKAEAILTKKQDSVPILEIKEKGIRKPTRKTATTKLSKLKFVREKKRVDKPAKVARKAGLRKVVEKVQKRKIVGRQVKLATGQTELRVGFKTKTATKVKFVQKAPKIKEKKSFNKALNFNKQQQKFANKFFDSKQVKNELKQPLENVRGIKDLRTQRALIKAKQLLDAKKKQNFNELRNRINKLIQEARIKSAKAKSKAKPKAKAKVKAGKKSKPKQKEKVAVVKKVSQSQIDKIFDKFDVSIKSDTGTKFGTRALSVLVNNVAIKSGISPKIAQKIKNDVKIQNISKNLIKNSAKLNTATAITNKVASVIEQSQRKAIEIIPIKPIKNGGKRVPKKPVKKVPKKQIITKKVIAKITKPKKVIIKTKKVKRIIPRTNRVKKTKTKLPPIKIKKKKPKKIIKKPKGIKKPTQLRFTATLVRPKKKDEFELFQKINKKSKGFRLFSGAELR